MGLKQLLLRALLRPRVAASQPGHLVLKFAKGKAVPATHRHLLDLLSAVLAWPEGVQQVDLQPELGRIIFAYDPDRTSAEVLEAHVASVIDVALANSSWLVDVKATDIPSALARLGAELKPRPR